MTTPSISFSLAVCGWALAAIFSVLALYLCFKFDLPTGAGVVCSLGLALLLTLIVSKFRK